MLKGSFKTLELIKTTARNAPWAMIAIVLHVIAVAVVSVVYIAQELSKEDNDTTTLSVAPPRPTPPVALPQIEPPRRDLVPDRGAAELVKFDDDTLVIPEPDAEPDLYLERGASQDSLSDLPPGASGNSGIGVGIGGYSGSKGPSGRFGRGGGGGGPVGDTTRSGPTARTEAAVLEGLRWLVRHQNADGSWGADTLRERCNPKHPCIAADIAVGANFNEGLTGLALLAFLGAGIRHDSKLTVVDTAMGREHSLGETVKRGLLWLVNRQKEDGSFSAGRPFMYNEALATMALTEAYGLSRNRYFEDAAERGVRFLVNAQKRSPSDDGLWGWRYESKAELDAALARGEIDDATYFVEKSNADISVTGWVIMALKSAAISGIEVPPEVLQGGLRYALAVTGENGLSGYVSRDSAGQKVSGPGDHFAYHTGTMSALNMLVRTFVAHDLEDPFLEQAARHLVTDLPVISKDKLSIDYYYWYYGSLALNQFDGPDSPRNAVTSQQKYWGPWKKEMERALLSLQDDNQERNACSRGGWLVNDRWSQHGHALYNTAINTLTLEVYYRYANAFGAGQREHAGKASSAQPR